MIGKYDKRVTIQKRTGDPDALGNIVPVWLTLADRWASIEDQGGSELYRAQKVDPTISAVVALREQYTGLSPKDRIVYTTTNGTRTLDIKAVLGASDRSPQHGQVLACSEGVA